MDPPPADEHLHTGTARSKRGPGPNSSLLVKTDLVKSLGGFDPELTILCDWDLMVRLSAESRGAMIPEPLVGYTIHQANLHQDDSMLAEELKRFEGKHAEARATSGVSLDRAAGSAGGSMPGARADEAGIGGGLLEAGWQRRDPGLAIRGMTLAVGGEGAMRVARRVRDRGSPQARPLRLPLACTGR